jgi:hypothetical protein
MEHVFWIRATLLLGLIVLVLNVVVLTARTVGTHVINYPLLIIKLPVWYRNKIARHTIRAVWIRTTFPLMLIIIAIAGALLSGLQPVSLLASKLHIRKCDLDLGRLGPANLCARDSSCAKKQKSGV